METMYQRGKIQEESLYYETLKHTGELPIMGVNTFLSSKGSRTMVPGEVIRATKEEKLYQIDMLERLHQHYSEKAENRLNKLKQSAIQNDNIFNSLKIIFIR